MLDPVVQIAIAYALAALWLAGAAHKIASPRRFRATVADYRVLPEALVPAAAFTVVALELGLGIALVAPIDRFVPLVVSSGLLTLYAAAVGVNLLRGRRHIDCGCAGPDLRQPLSAWIVGRNLALAAAALAGALPVEPRALLWLDVVTVIATVGILAAIYATLNRLVANVRKLRGLE